jgi:hypothetical protein
MDMGWNLDLRAERRRRRPWQKGVPDDVVFFTSKEREKEQLDANMGENCGKRKSLTKYHHHYRICNYNNEACMNDFPINSRHPFRSSPLPFFPLPDLLPFGSLPWRLASLREKYGINKNNNKEHQDRKEKVPRPKSHQHASQSHRSDQKSRKDINPETPVYQIHPSALPLYVCKRREVVLRLRAEDQQDGAKDHVGRGHSV